MDVLWRLAGLAALVCANGFFVAAEFSIVTVRKTRIDQLIAEGHRGARAVRRAVSAPDRYIAATQLGITMASLGLGWIGEPALASMIERPIEFLPPYVAAATAHTIAVAIAFTTITAVEIVFGELTPKWIALERSEMTAMWVVRPLELFMRSLASPSGGATLTAGTLAREVLTVPETLGANDLLAEMRRRRVREAIVIDEYGGTAGLVTFETLMERIIGEVPGELGSPATVRITVRADGSADVDGLALVTDVNAQFDLHIDEDTYTTIGGYALGRLGRRPKIGDTIEVEDRKMRVEAVDGLRVAKVWLSRPGRRATAHGAEEASR